ncbi:MAG: glycosyltransferase [Candidatus Lokiarchaeota archaeon]|nr:glycosyltransferase [Candidatus Lokiarchaeota archaeon]
MMTNITSKPIVTVIIPTYKRPQLLKRAIESVLHQTYPNFKICIYDNASNDSTAEVIAKFQRQDNRVFYHRQKKNIGAINNFNYGMRQVSTPYFSLLADDNVILPDFLETGIESLKKYGEAIFFASQTIRMDERNNRLSGSLDKWKTGLVHPPNGIINILEKEIPIWDGVLFRRSVLNKVGYLNTDFNSSVDQDYMMRIARYHTFYVLKKPGAIFYVHSNSWSTKLDLKIVVETLEKRLAPWLTDNDLPDEFKTRIYKSLKIRRDAAIRRFVLNDAIIGTKSSTIKSAIQIKSKYNDLSFKAIRIIYLAKIINYNSVIKKTISNFMQFFILFKHRFVFLKNLGKYREQSLIKNLYS